MTTDTGITSELENITSTLIVTSEMHAPSASEGLSTSSTVETPKKHTVELLRVHIFEAKFTIDPKAFSVAIKPYVLVANKNSVCRTSNGSEQASNTEEKRVTWNESHIFLVDTKKAFIPILINFNDMNRPDNKHPFLGTAHWQVPRATESKTSGTTVTFPVHDTWLELAPKRREDGFKGSIHINADLSSIEEFDKEGILLKRGDSLFTAWSRRYFLIKDHLLFWYKLKGTLPRGYLDISETNIDKLQPIKSDSSKVNKIYPFEITKKHGPIAEPIILAALSEQERDEWIRFLAKGSLVKRAADYKPMLEPVRKNSIFGTMFSKPDVNKILASKIKEEDEEEKDEKEEPEKATDKIELEPALFNASADSKPTEKQENAPATTEEPKKDEPAVPVTNEEPKKDEPLAESSTPVTEEPKKDEPVVPATTEEPKKDEPVVPVTNEEPKKDEPVVPATEEPKKDEPVTPATEEPKKDETPSESS